MQLLQLVLWVQLQPPLPVVPLLQEPVLEQPVLVGPLEYLQYLIALVAALQLSE